MAKFDNVEIFEEGTIIELTDDTESPVEFYEIASIEYGGKFYELLQPVESIDGIGEDEAVILEYVLDDDKDEKQFKPVFDEELLNEIFEEYLRALSDADEEGCSCGHGCGGDCGGDCANEGEHDDENSCGCESGCGGCKEKK